MPPLSGLGSFKVCGVSSGSLFLHAASVWPPLSSGLCWQCTSNNCANILSWCFRGQSEFYTNISRTVVKINPGRILHVSFGSVGALYSEHKYFAEEIFPLNTKSFVLHCRYGLFSGGSHLSCSSICRAFPQLSSVCDELCSRFVDAPRRRQHVGALQNAARWCRHVAVAIAQQRQCAPRWRFHGRSAAQKSTISDSSSLPALLRQRRCQLDLERRAYLELLAAVLRSFLHYRWRCARQL